MQTKIVRSTPPPTKLDKQPMPQKTPKARQAEVCAPKQENLRDTVRKTFFEQLSNRLKKCEDLKLSDDDLNDEGLERERISIVQVLRDTGKKYKRISTGI